eukprot:Nk52_evm40s1671 gene=Nk52_evmTU40s1671
MLGNLVKRQLNRPTWIDHKLQRWFSPFRRLGNPTCRGYTFASIQEAPLELRGTMTVNDYIQKCLYSENGGYFEENANILSPLKPLDFGKIANKRELDRKLAALYENPEDTTQNVKGKNLEAWHTPVEIFRPWFGQAVGKYVWKVAEDRLETLKDNEEGKVHIVEMGGGNGTLCVDILKYLKSVDSSLYDQIQYTIVEISSTMAKRQEQSVLEGLGEDVLSRGTVNIVNESILAWQPQTFKKECFVLGIEVMDNLPHDKVMFDNKGNGHQCVVEYLEESKRWNETLVNGVEEDVEQFLTLKYGDNGFAKPSFWSRMLPLEKFSLPDVEYVPTSCFRMLKQVRKWTSVPHFVLADFDELIGCMEGLNAPRVQKRDGKESAVQHTYLNSEGTCDIFFPTDFEALDSMARLLWENQLQETSMLKQSEFMNIYAHTSATHLANGYNPLVKDYPNFKFFLS